MAGAGPIAGRCPKWGAAGGKLRGAVEYLLNGGDRTADAAEAFRRRGFRVQAAALKRGYEVLPEAWETVTEIWPRLSTQWRIGPMGGFLGLDYPGVESLLRIERVKNRRETFRQIQIMEVHAREILNERIKRKRPNDRTR